MTGRFKYDVVLWKVGPEQWWLELKGCYESTSYRCVDWQWMSFGVLANGSADDWRGA